MSLSVGLKLLFHKRLLKRKYLDILRFHSMMLFHRNKQLSENKYVSVSGQRDQITHGCAHVDVLVREGWDICSEEGDLPVIIS